MHQKQLDIESGDRKFSECAYLNVKPQKVKCEDLGDWFLFHSFPSHNSLQQTIN